MSKTVLVIEDDQSLNKAIVLKLNRKGYKVISFFSAEEAMPVLEEETVDFIWLDILLPGMNGLEFLGKIREKPSMKDKKVAIVSVSGGLETREKAKSLGVVDYIVKSEYRLNDIIDRIVRGI